MLQLVNPKAYVVNTTLFSGFPIFADAYGAEVAVKVSDYQPDLDIDPLLVALGRGVGQTHGVGRAKTQRVINVGMAGAMLLVVALAALSTL